jgi:hypothetical protein
MLARQPRGRPANTAALEPRNAIARANLAGLVARAGSAQLALRVPARG